MKGQQVRGYDGPNTSEIGCRGLYRLYVIVGGMYAPFSQAYSQTPIAKS
jgi:hypothetical protein